MEALILILEKGKQITCLIKISNIFFKFKLQSLAIISYYLKFNNILSTVKAQAIIANSWTLNKFEVKWNFKKHCYFKNTITKFLLKVDLYKKRPNGKVNSCSKNYTSYESKKDFITVTTWAVKISYTYLNKNIEGTTFAKQANYNEICKVKWKSPSRVTISLLKASMLKHEAQWRKNKNSTCMFICQQ